MAMTLNVICFVNDKLQNVEFKMTNNQNLYRHQLMKYELKKRFHHRFIKER